MFEFVKKCLERLIRRKLNMTGVDSFAATAKINKEVEYTSRYRHNKQHPNKQPKYKWPKGFIYWSTSIYYFNNGVIKLL